MTLATLHIGRLYDLIPKKMIRSKPSIHPDGTLLLVEAVLTPSIDPTSALMGHVDDGLEQRPRANPIGVRSIVQEAGFSMVQVIRAAGVSIIESRPV